MTSETKWDNEFPQCQMRRHNEILYNTVCFRVLKEIHLFIGYVLFMTRGNIILLSDPRKDFRETHIYASEYILFINECIMYA